MQPLYSVDHETRHGANWSNDDSAPQEDTPLLNRFPQQEMEQQSLVMLCSVSLLLIMLVAGIIIGTYLMALQSASENVLPTVEMPFQMVTRKQWRSATSFESVLVVDGTIPKVKQVIVVQTDTEPCSDIATCGHIMQGWQTFHDGNEKLLPFNFLVASNGITYEGLGWHRTSPLFPAFPNALVLGFIGDYTKTPPSELQLNAAKSFLAESVTRDFLVPDYVIFGKNSIYKPKHLFNSLKTLPNWNNELTDKA